MIKLEFNIPEDKRVLYNTVDDLRTRHPRPYNKMFIDASNKVILFLNYYDTKPVFVRLTLPDERKADLCALTEKGLHNYNRVEWPVYEAPPGITFTITSGD